MLFFIWFHYILEDDSKLLHDYMNKKYSVDQFILGLILTVVLWPVTIYNQEFRKK